MTTMTIEFVGFNAITQFSREHGSECGTVCGKREGPDLAKSKIAKFLNALTNTCLALFLAELSLSHARAPLS